MVALAIFAVLGVMAYGGLDTVLRSDAESKQQAERLKVLQMAFARLQRDLNQYTPRWVRSEFGEPLPAFIGQPAQMSFTRAGWSNPLGQRRSMQQRVSYALEDNTLYRVYWRHLDPPPDGERYKTPILKDVALFRLRYLDSESTTHEEWPPQSIDNPPLLRGVEVSLELETDDTLTWLFEIKSAVITEFIPELDPESGESAINTQPARPTVIEPR